MNSPVFSFRNRPFLFSAASIYCCFLLGILTSQPAAAESKAEDTALTLQVLEDFKLAERTAARKPVTDEEASYRSQLEKFQKTAQDAGNLKSVLAAKDAITELDAGRPPLVSDDAGVAAIQKTHIALRQKAEAESAKALAKIDQDFLASLKKLVVDLTKAGKIEEAVEVQAKVDELASAPTPEAAMPHPASEENEIWKTKAMEEFPALKQPGSELAKSIKALTEKKKATAPDFFRNPQWPYLLAKEANLVLQQAAKVRSERRFPAEAKSFNGKKYLVYEDKVTWDKARIRCKEAGGQLVVIPDAATQEFVRNVAKGRQLWLGASDERKEGKWIWVNGTKMEYQAFLGGQPDNCGGNEHFLHTWAGGRWNDATEGGDAHGINVIGYICEWQETSP